MNATHFIIILLALIAGFSYQYYLSYFKESGKQKVMNDNIETLTKTVKGIENKLQLEAVVQTSVYSETKAAAIEFYESFQAGYATITGIGLIEFKNQDDVSRVTNIYITVRANIVSKFSKLNLYAEDSQIEALLDEILTELSALSRQEFGIIYTMYFSKTQRERWESESEETTDLNKKEELKKRAGLALGVAKGQTEEIRMKADKIESVIKEKDKKLKQLIRKYIMNETVKS